MTIINEGLSFANLKSVCWRSRDGFGLFGGIEALVSALYALSLYLANVGGCVWTQSHYGHRHAVPPALIFGLLNTTSMPHSQCAFLASQ